MDYSDCVSKSLQDPCQVKRKLNRAVARRSAHNQQVQQVTCDSLVLGRVESFLFHAATSALLLQFTNSPQNVLHSPEVFLVNHWSAEHLIAKELAVAIMELVAATSASCKLWIRHVEGVSTATFPSSTFV